MAFSPFEVTLRSQLELHLFASFWGRTEATGMGPAPRLGMTLIQTVSMLFCTPYSKELTIAPPWLSG